MDKSDEHIPSDNSGPIDVVRKRLAIFLDGTWNDGRSNTNVWRLNSLLSTPLQKCTMCRFKSAPLCWCGGLSIDTASRSGPHGRRSGAGAVVKPGFEVFMLFVCYDCA